MIFHNESHISRSISALLLLIRESDPYPRNVSTRELFAATTTRQNPNARATHSKVAPATHSSANGFGPMKTEDP